MSKLIVLTETAYNAIPADYRGVWVAERKDWPNWDEIKDKYMGKRTLLTMDDDGATALLIEGIHLEIVSDDTA